MLAAGHNQPCPCGSGKRYKDCHGALVAGTPAPSAPPPDPAAGRRLALMHEALALQQAGGLAAAIAKYELVIAEEPDNFDALHMLGVAWFQSNKLELAEDHILRALAIRPDVATAQFNLKLIREGRALEAKEFDLCRAVLPRLTRLCLPMDASAAARGTAQIALDLVLAA